MVVFALLALLVGVIAIVRSKFQSLEAWGVLFLAIAILFTQIQRNI